MKKLIFIFILMVSFQVSKSIESFNLKPIKIDFEGVVAKDDIIIAYGNYGSYMISYDNDKTWETKKAFEKGTIFKMFFEENRIVAFTKNGQIATSNDNANNWITMPRIDITTFEDDLYDITNAVKIKSGYLIRKKKYIYFIDNDLKLVKKIDYPFGKNINPGYYRNYILNSLVVNENKVYIPYGNSNIAILNENTLEVDKEINLKEILKLECEDCKYLNSLFIADNFIFTQFNSKFYKIDTTFTKFDTLINYNKTLLFKGQINNDFIFGDNFYYEKYNTKQNTSDKYVYIIPEKYTKYGIDYTQGKSVNFSFIAHNNKFIEVGYDNNIKIAYLDDKNENVIDYKIVSSKSASNISDLEIVEFPINSHKFIAYTKVNYDLSLGITNCNFNENLFQPIINVKEYYLDLPFAENKWILSYGAFNNIPLYHFDKKENSIIMGFNRLKFGNYLYYSTNGGQTFDSLADLENYVSFTDITKSKLIKQNNENIIIWSYKSTNGEFLTNYTVFDVNFNFKTRTIFKNQDHYLAEIKDTNNFDVFSVDMQLYKFSYKGTTNKGQSWETYKDYPLTKNLIDIKELELNNKKIWAFTYYDFVTSQCNLDVIDVEERKVYNVFSSQLTQDQIDSINYIGFDAAKEKFYFTFFNTLMVSSNIFEDNIKWETFNYPNNGKVNKKFQIFDKTIFARYEDDKNEDNVYWINGIEMVGDPTSVEDNSQIEEVSYLYTTPPYPNPSVSEVTAKFYWDSRIDIDNSDIAVFDITGNKVSGKENLTLEKLNEWSGNIKWNCVGVPSGTYLIKIQHGNNTKSVKVVVN